MKLTRRHFSIALTAAALGGFRMTLAQASNRQQVKGYGTLVPDPDGLIDLPPGFSYRVISSFGSQMSDGLTVPDKADGMGCFSIGNGMLALIRNHELKAGDIDLGAKATALNAFDRNKGDQPLPGGTTTIIYDPVTGLVEQEFVSLIGTIRNCAGGTTPWGSWLSCEEDVSKKEHRFNEDHGWVFEVPASATGPVPAKPLKDLGRFKHEAAAVDPRTGIVYLTEDRDDSLFYRFVPHVPGKLAKGGRLQALGFTDAPGGGDSRNWDAVTWRPGDWKHAFWIDLEDTHSPEDDLRARGHAGGAAKFARGEGIHWGDGELYFCCTSGGASILGQIMRYRPSPFEGMHKEGDEPGTIQLFLESEDPHTFNFGDNLTVAPNGDLFVCEDQYTDTVDNHIRGVTPQGRTYDFARIRVQTEPAGACFSPDGKTFFVNLYSPAKTLAITGPWQSVREGT